jgi:alpha-ribazole phosphatase
MATVCDLYLVRHGLTEWNLQKRYLGHTDQGLVEREVWRLELLRNSLEATRFDRVYCSDLVRCQQTLQLIYPNSGRAVCLEPNLREIHFGEWEGLTYEQLKSNETYRRWIDNPLKTTPSAGEKWVDFQQRINAFLMQVLTLLPSHLSDDIPDGNRIAGSKSKDNILIVTHGGVIRQLLSLLIPTRGFWDWEVKNGSAIRLKLERQEEEWKCYSWSEVPMQAKER